MNSILRVFPNPRKWPHRLPAALLLRMLAVLAGLLGFWLLYRATGHVVILELSPESWEIHTHARTVGGVLAETGLLGEEEIEIDIPLDTPLTSFQVLTLTTLKRIGVVVEGERTEILSASPIPSDWLTELGIRLYPGDSLHADGVRVDPIEPIAAFPREIELRRAIDISLEEGEEITHLRSSAYTLGEALWEGGIILRAGDLLQPGPETVLQDSLTASLTRSVAFTLEVDGFRADFWSAGPTVGDAIGQAGAGLFGLDYSDPTPDSVLTPGMLIRIIGVTEEVLVEQEPLAFETIFQPDPNLEIDKQGVIQAGKYGVLAKRIKIRYENGEEVGREIEDEWQAVEPEVQILAYGTQIIVRTLATPDGTIEYWRAVPVYATSYMDCPGQDPGCGARTASGKEVEVGMIGVLRSWFNAMRGWPVYVPTYGRATIEDIGAGIAGRDWIDLAYPNEVYIPWAKWTTLYFLTPVPPADSILYILP